MIYDAVLVGIMIVVGAIVLAVLVQSIFTIRDLRRQERRDRERIVKEYRLPLDAKQYDKAVSDFIDGKISYDEFVNLTPPIPLPPSLHK